MTIPKSFEMVHSGEIHIVSYRQGEGHWEIFVDGEPFARGIRNSQNDWTVVAGKIKYRGRILQEAVMDCVREDLRKEEIDLD